MPGTNTLEGWKRDMCDKFLPLLNVLITALCSCLGHGLNDYPSLLKVVISAASYRRSMSFRLPLTRLSSAGSP